MLKRQGSGRILLWSLIGSTAAAAVLCAFALLKPQPAVVLMAVGDILLGRDVSRQIEQHEPDHPFRAVGPILRAADIAFGNLECPITETGVPVPKPFSFRALPRHADGLARAGFDVLSVANNHTLDCGRQGLADTVRYLDQRGIAACGAIVPGVTGTPGATLVRNGLRIRFLAFCDVVQDASFPDPEGVDVLRASPEAVRRWVGHARTDADLVVVSFHWGREYQPRPTERQRALARSAANAGAALVIGHHPHVVQGMEWIGRGGRGTLVAYSLGNFIFDSAPPATRRSVILRVVLGRSGVLEARALPVIIERCAPHPAAASQAGHIRHRLTELSRELGTDLSDGCFRPPHQPGMRIQDRTR